ncbi:MAG: DUF2163 domain-containing protein [Rubellimicrobium sp.]|nr:DUF2163 domain-containing protein [Rubellimicrobium sp.]
MNATTQARAWAVTRRDGVTLGFTDHDRALSFEGITFAPDSGLTARAVVATSGLAIDNSEVLGALSGAAISEADIEAGRYDGAGVRLWVVDWRDVARRHLRFRGTLGEIRRGEGAFHAELRGLTERLNQPRGRSFERSCPAVLGDAACGFDVARAGFSAEITLPEAGDGQRFRFAVPGDHADGWFAHGRLEVLTGAARGLVGIIKEDRLRGAMRAVLLWAPLRAPLAAGDRLRLVAGCDRRAETCRAKFDNMLNFQGFPHLPGDNWLLVGPRE